MKCKKKKNNNNKNGFHMPYIHDIEIEFHYRNEIIDLECIKYEIWHIFLRKNLIFKKNHSFLDILKLNQTFSIDKSFKKQIRKIVD